MPDELTIGLIRERLSEDDADRGFVLDGFPRNAAQAEALDDLLEELDRPLDVVLDLQVPDGLHRGSWGVPRRRAAGRQPRGDREAARDLPPRTEPLIGLLPRGIVVGVHGARRATKCGPRSSGARAGDGGPQALLRAADRWIEGTGRFPGTRDDHPQVTAEIEWIAGGGSSRGADAAGEAVRA